MSACAFPAAADGRERGILPPPAFFAATFAVTAVAWSAALWLWSAGQRPFAVSAFALGLSLGPCLTAYATVPRSMKQRQRRVVLAAGAASILAPGLLGAGRSPETASAVLVAVAVYFAVSVGLALARRSRAA